ncbi:IS30 family transposase [Mesorhizobium sp. M0138]|uniref:IS30 family transposase n=1 Tax=Mesorhizobium sp. M0138 TaxID=2956891 RepID=UPI003339F8B1
MPRRAAAIWITGPVPPDGTPIVRPGGLLASWRSIRLCVNGQQSHQPAWRLIRGPQGGYGKCGGLFTGRAGGGRQPWSPEQIAKSIFRSIIQRIKPCGSATRRSISPCTFKDAELAPRTDRMSAFRPSVARTARTGPSAQQVLHWRRRYHKRPSGRNCRSGCPRTLGRRPHPFGSSAIGTLVERSSRFTMLLHLPRMHGYQQSLRIKNGPPLAGHGAEAVRRAIARSMDKLPEQLRQSLTWDQGAEMAQHADLRIDTGLEIYFCDPQARGSEAPTNTNGLLRQYFPKGTDLSRHTARELDAVAHAINTRPRKTLGCKTPAEVLDQFLGGQYDAGVATTG